MRYTIVELSCGKEAPTFEMLYKTTIDYSTFRVFGCLVFASTLTAHRTKFQPRSGVCVLIGYPPSIKGYKLYDVQSK